VPDPVQLDGVLECDSLIAKRGDYIRHLHAQLWATLYSHRAQLRVAREDLERWRRIAATLGVEAIAGLDRNSWF
jgi:hypothetical protein